MTVVYEEFYGNGGLSGNAGVSGAGGYGDNGSDGSAGDSGNDGQDLSRPVTVFDASLSYVITQIAGYGGGGGQGGAGGNTPTAGYHGGQGGAGGSGGAGGDSTLTFYNGTFAQLYVSIESGGGGTGGLGGVAGNDLASLASGGVGGTGGLGGNGTLLMTGATLHSQSTIFVAAGNTGGQGGAANSLGTHPVVSGGMGGRGGDGLVSLTASQFDFSSHMEFHAAGGAGGDGGVGNGHAAGGGGGDATISLIGNTFSGTHGDGYLSLTLEMARGAGGISGADISGTAGSTTGASGTGHLVMSGNSFVGDTGYDTLILDIIGDSATHDVTVNMATGTLDFGSGSNTFTSIDDFSLHFSEADGSVSSRRINFTGSEGRDIFWSGDGDDTINGNGGNDELHGHQGNDTLNGGAGDDYIDTRGGSAYDMATQTTTYFESGIDHIDGGTGFDTISVDKWYLTQDVIFDVDAMKTGMTMVDGTTIVNVEALEFISTGSGDDTLILHDLPPVFHWYAGDGSNTLVMDFSATSTALLTNYGGADFNIDNPLADDGVSYFSTVKDISQVVLSGGSANDTLAGTYGVDTLTGNGGDDRLYGFLGADIMKGGAGNDSYFVDNAGDVVTELANQGTDTVYASINYTLGANVENLTAYPATGNITLTGNGLANEVQGAIDWGNTAYGLAGDDKLYGGRANDVMDGGTGADYMMGDLGNDTYYVDNVGDDVGENYNAGTDKVFSTVSFDMSQGYRAYIENLTLTGTANIKGTGNDLDNSLTGNSGQNILTGLAGNDTLDGKGGADKMIGGAGNDIYYVDNAGDGTIEAKGEGIDTVYASVTYAMKGEYIENLYLTGMTAINGTGNALDNSIYGNAGNNILSGGAGSDILDGGKGNDRLIGGQGDDVYYVDSFSDVVIEAKGEGADTVISSVQYIMGGQYVENAQLTGKLNSYVVGNALDNFLLGNDGNNNLTGGAGNDILNGGGGADGLRGGVGDDSYTVDNLGDFVVENKDEGWDNVYASVSFNLGAQYIENLILTGTDNINGLGNALLNTITGNAGNNVLDGRQGADTMSGGAGNDIYYVDNLGDRVYEATGQGTDTVISSVTFALGSQYIENLTLTGTGKINGSGNSLANIIIGNGNANTLSGGAGSDTLTGGGGADIFVFGLNSGADAITDFSRAQNDKIDISAYHVEALILTRMGANTVVDLGGGNKITITGMNPSDPDVLNHFIL